MPRHRAARGRTRARTKAGGAQRAGRFGAPSQVRIGIRPSPVGCRPRPKQSRVGASAARPSASGNVRNAAIRFWQVLDQRVT